ncbi:MAG: polysaccharide deacetylase family protein [Planctomycetaceae bacterium]
MIVGWHGVSLADEHCRFPSLFISPQSFEQRIQYLQRHYTIITMDEAVAQLREGRVAPGQVVLTFDDGYFNFLAKAVPILDRYNLTATNYIVAHHTESQALHVGHMVDDILFSCERGTYTIPLLGEIELKGPEQRQAVAKECKRQLERRAAPRRVHLLREIAEALQFDAGQIINSRRWQSLNPSEVKRLAGEGHLMQIHGHRHRDAVNHFDELSEEVVVCKESVERMTARRAVHFCYPSGLWDKRAWTILAALGVESAVTTRLGPNFPRTPILALRRVLNGENRSQIEFEFQMSNLRWLLHILIRPWRIFAPSEKKRPYRDCPVPF